MVVDTEETGKKLLKNGDLQSRVTIIPLNKIQTYTIPDRVQQAARRLVSASPLTSLVILVDVAFWFVMTCLNEKYILICFVGWS